MVFLSWLEFELSILLRILRSWNRKTGKLLFAFIRAGFPSRAWIDSVSNFFNTYTDPYFKDHAIKMLQDIRSGLIIEVGCSSGANLDSFTAHLNAKGIGIDIDGRQQLVWKGLQRIMPQLNFIHADGRFLPLRDDASNLCICMEVVEHVKDYDKILHEAWRVLSEDGFFLTSTPHGIGPYAPPRFGHIHDLTPTLREDLERTGFRVIKVSTQDLTHGYTLRTLAKKTPRSERRPDFVSEVVFKAKTASQKTSMIV